MLRSKTIILLVSIVISNIDCYRYTLPGDANWPPKSAFLELRSTIAGNAIFKGDDDFKPFTWNTATNTPKPAVIIQPKDKNDIITGLAFAKKYNIRVSVQSTGHHQDTRNIFDNSVHFEMKTMNSINIDLASKTLTLGPGNNFTRIEGYVADKSNRQLVALCGADPGVGIYGWTVGGGHGPFTRLYGLGVDALLSVELVLANLTVVTASETQNSDLFRALRGSGGGAYGIAISLTVRLFENPGKVSNLNGLYELSEKTAKMFANWMLKVPNELSAYYLPNNIDNKKYVIISAKCLSNDGAKCSTYLNQLKDGCISFIIPGADCNVNTNKYNNFYEFFLDQKSEVGNVPIFMASTELNADTLVDGLTEITGFIERSGYTGCSGNSVMGGMSATLDPDQSKTSVSPQMRKTLMAITCFAVRPDNDVTFRKTVSRGVEEFAEFVLKKYSTWVYWNEPTHVFPNNEWKSRYWNGLDNYNKLLVVKQKYDPDNLFNCFHCIGYDGDASENPQVCPRLDCTCSNTPNGECNK